MGYSCILRTDERVDADALYQEFEQVCAKDLASAHEGQTAWSGVRVFDLVSANRIEELPLLSQLLDRLGRESVVMVNYYNMAPESMQHEHRDQSGNLLLASRVFTFHCEQIPRPFSGLNGKIITFLREKSGPLTPQDVMLPSMAGQKIAFT